MADMSEDRLTRIEARLDALEAGSPPTVVYVVIDHMRPVAAFFDAAEAHRETMERADGLPQSVAGACMFEVPLR